MKNECNIIRDILPLYIENIASKDSVSFVDEHMEKCEKCRVVLADMRVSASIEENYKNNTTEDAIPLQLLKKKMNRKKLLTIIISSVATLIAVLGMLFLTIMYGFPVHSENINIETEFQYCEGVYLDQEFVLHMNTIDGMPLYVTVNDKYETDENGEEILVGYEIIPRTAVLNLGQNPNSFAIGYSPSFSGIIESSEDFDFIITIKFKDKEVNYSMVEEGAFEVQENVIDYTK